MNSEFHIIGHYFILFEFTISCILRHNRHLKWSNSNKNKSNFFYSLSQKITERIKSNLRAIFVPIDRVWIFFIPFHTFMQFIIFLRCPNKNQMIVAVLHNKGLKISKEIFGKSNFKKLAQANCWIAACPMKIRVQTCFKLTCSWCIVLETFRKILEEIRNEFWRKTTWRCKNDN